MASDASSIAYLLRKPPRRVRVRHKAIVLSLLVLGVALGALWYELSTMRLQASVFSHIARAATYRVEAGPSSRFRFPVEAGPYDLRLGYARLPKFLKRLQSHEFVIGAQAVLSPTMAALADHGLTGRLLRVPLFLPYREKDQTGLTINAANGATIYQARYPERIYPDFRDVPPLLAAVLLYIENRTLLGSGSPTRNPALEESRFAKALIDETMHQVLTAWPSPGASTLATQIEKYRHSQGGRTGTPREKLRQMLSASLRAYLGGPDTLVARHHVVVEYLNTVPLAARPSYGEISGIGDGMWAWYGRPFAEVNRVLENDPTVPLVERASVFKEVLSLIISQRSPDYYLNGHRQELESLTNAHLRLLARDNLISQTLCNTALKLKLRQQPVNGATASATPIEQKGVSGVRLRLANLLGVPRLYDLDRLDLTVGSTLDASLQQAVTSELMKLRDPEYDRRAGLDDKELLRRGDPAGVTYSFTLVERTPGSNKVRVQADNFDEPLDINSGTKLDLGSTAKLRTLITYLQIVADLNRRYGGLSTAQLAKLSRSRHRSPITRWAINYLELSTDHSLQTMLEAALQRTYSANPDERFFTGGGIHTFVNFDKDDNDRIVTVREATQRSINLAYVRLMRDIVRYYIESDVGDSAQLLADRNDPRRTRYLQRFADREGQTFLARFFYKYRGRSLAADDALLVAHARGSQTRLAVIFRSIEPSASRAQMAAFLAQWLTPPRHLDAQRITRLYTQYGPDRLDLADRAYQARVHPLELWMVGYLHAHPKAGWAEVVAASKHQRQGAYAWLFQRRSFAAQNQRIAEMLEVDAFGHIYQAWRQLGYPFDNLIPSYATALGASADRPSSLTELMGILCNDGMRLPTTHIDRLHFAAATPYDTTLAFAPAVGKRVLAPEIAKLVRQVLSEVVTEGTARRVRGAFRLPDGRQIPIGGKTGTGDNRFKTFAKGGRLTSERVVSRSGAFVFYIGDRYFGTLLAYVAGPKAADYDFTSALPVQVLRLLAPTLMRSIESSPKSAVNFLRSDP